MTRTAWRATDPSGMAHMYIGSGARALCGMPSQPERFDWPARVRCALCTVKEARQEEDRKQRVTV